MSLLGVLNGNGGRAGKGDLGFSYKIEAPKIREGQLELIMQVIELPCSPRDLLGVLLETPPFWIYYEIEKRIKSLAAEDPRREEYENLKKMVELCLQIQEKMTFLKTLCVSQVGRQDSIESVARVLLTTFEYAKLEQENVLGAKNLAHYLQTIVEYLPQLQQQIILILRISELYCEVLVFEQQKILELKHPQLLEINYISHAYDSILQSIIERRFEDLATLVAYYEIGGAYRARWEEVLAEQKRIQHPPTEQWAMVNSYFRDLDKKPEQAAMFLQIQSQLMQDIKGFRKIFDDLMQNYTPEKFSKFDEFVRELQDYYDVVIAEVETLVLEFAECQRRLAELIAEGQKHQPQQLSDLLNFIKIYKDRISMCNYMPFIDSLKLQIDALEDALPSATSTTPASPSGKST